VTALKLALLILPPKRRDKEYEYSEEFETTEDH
jgi:hypothetical protein